MAVLDLMTQEQLWAGNVYSHPKWSPNGAYLAVITDAYNYTGVRGLISVDVNNPSHRVTLPIDFHYPHTIDHFTWSPNSRYIAVTNNLALIDVENNQVTDYCLDSDNNNFYWIFPPIWSPDSKFMTISIQKDGAWDTIIVDIGNNKAYKLAKDDIAFGWMINP